MAIRQDILIDEKPHIVLFGRQHESIARLRIRQGLLLDVDFEILFFVEGGLDGDGERTGFDDCGDREWGLWWWWWGAVDGEGGVQGAGVEEEGDEFGFFEGV
jgi:hypothetical protein